MTFETIWLHFGWFFGGRQSSRGFAVATGGYRAEVLGERELFVPPETGLRGKRAPRWTQNSIKTIKKQHKKSMEF
jgi:hypothetical protein